MSSVDLVEVTKEWVVEEKFGFVTQACLGVCYYLLGQVMHCMEDLSEPGLWRHDCLDN